jgi:hypothetical protein
MLAKELGRALEQVPVNLCKISRTVKYKLLLHVAILTLRERWELFKFPAISLMHKSDTKEPFIQVTVKVRLQ